MDIYWQIVGERNGVGCHNLAWNVLAIQYFGDPMSSHTVRPGKLVAREGEREGGVTVGGAWCSLTWWRMSGSVKLLVQARALPHVSVFVSVAPCWPSPSRILQSVLPNSEQLEAFIVCVFKPIHCHFLSYCGKGRSLDSPVLELYWVCVCLRGVYWFCWLWA